MNNSKFAIENTPLTLEETRDVEPLKEKEADVIQTIEALRVIQESNEWRTLKTKVFDGLAERLIKEIHQEARKDQPNPLRLNRLSGELKWAERFADLSVFEQTKRLELTQLRKLLYGTPEKVSG